MLQRSRTFFMLLKATTNWRVLGHDAQREVFDADEWRYEAAVEALSAQPLFGAPPLEIVDVIAGIEDDLAIALPDPLPLEAFEV